ncbi:rab-like protein 3 [Watersipora subatra]|uniref:rab-like protein 3 n=1 Tax=Watersipora subatra TaxID=2589382 RepID=UPI00355C8E24
MSTVDKVRVLIVGDSETGKTSMSHLIAHGSPCERPMSTIGCSTQVKLHDYRAGLPGEKAYFIELWDIGGSRGHEVARSLFYGTVDGIILVHDLTNRKSQTNLHSWLREVSNHRDGGKLRQVLTEYDKDSIASTVIPTIVIGTKLDLLTGGEPSRSFIADDCNAEEINLDCTSNKYLTAGSSNAVKLSKFFDKVIQKTVTGGVSSPTTYPRELYSSGQERKRTYSPSRAYGSPSSYVD